MKAVVAAFNQEKALVGAFSVITNLRMELFEALVGTLVTTIGIWSQRWEGGGGLVGAAGRQLVSCVLVQSPSKYSRVGQLGWTLTASWHQPTLCHLGPATAGWHHSGIYQLSVIITSCQRYFAKFSQYSEKASTGVLYLGSEWWKYDFLKIHFSADFLLEEHLLWSIIS